MGRNDQRRRQEKAIKKLEAWQGRHPKGPSNAEEHALLGRLLHEAGVERALGRMRPADVTNNATTSTHT